MPPEEIERALYERAGGTPETLDQFFKQLDEIKKGFKTVTGSPARDAEIQKKKQQQEQIMERIKKLEEMK